MAYSTPFSVTDFCTSGPVSNDPKLKKCSAPFGISGLATFYSCGVAFARWVRVFDREGDIDEVLKGPLDYLIRSRTNRRIFRGGGEVAWGSRMTLGEFYRALARLGGHLGNFKSKPPDWQTLWHGWRWLNAMAQGLRNARMSP